MAVSDRDAKAIDTRARAIGAAWPSPSDEQRERLAILFSGPWLDDDDDDPDPTKDDKNPLSSNLSLGGCRSAAYGS
jgi:hypothetical protein